jgi:hypothetical protein
MRRVRLRPERGGILPPEGVAVEVAALGKLPRGLNPATGTGGKADPGSCRPPPCRTRQVAPASGSLEPLAKGAALSHEGAPTIDGIDITDFQRAEEQAEWLEKRAPAFLRPTGP